MNILTSNSMLMLQRSMGFLWSKQDCILNNLANAETPGYKTQYVTFEESLRDAVQAAADKPQPGAAMREAIVDTGWTTMGWILWSSRWSWREMAIRSSMS